ncbi:hypothetical protein KW795_00015 [Candidatus Microgenomates bacterium]|nr:hypothetical protein [Candidatus Microgenomates bacterium]
MVEIISSVVAGGTTEPSLDITSKNPQPFIQKAVLAEIDAFYPFYSRISRDLSKLHENLGDITGAFFEIFAELPRDTDENF